MKNAKKFYFIKLTKITFMMIANLLNLFVLPKTVVLLVIKKNVSIIVLNVL